MEVVELKTKGHGCYNAGHGACTKCDCADGRADYGIEKACDQVFPVMGLISVIHFLEAHDGLGRTMCYAQACAEGFQHGRLDYGGASRAYGAGDG